MPTSSSNIRRLRSGVIGSISAWLPSRRSTAHQRGATVVVRSGQVRSGSGTAANGAYLPIGIAEGCWVLRACGWVLMAVALLVCRGVRSGSAGWARAITAAREPT
ncbi:unannotated protein [freshwater metagenome]|uniref:Unannotated protein n=1 Tax=freshwater metagenome TaxID=449393 RepID=A0A6J7HWC8_9ZZZZ